MPPPPSLVCTSTIGPGRTPIHRLTRLEYDRTIAALLGDPSRPAELFPADPSQAGFDNVSDVQTVSLLHAEKYEEAARLLAEGVWQRELDPGLSKRWELETRSETPGPELLLQACCGLNQHNNFVRGGARGLYNAYRVYTITELDREGDYTVTVSAWTEGVDTATIAFRPLNLQILYNEQPISSVALTATIGAPAQVVGRFHAEAAGFQRIDVQLFDPTGYSNPPELPKVWIDWLRLERASVRTSAPPLVRQCELAESGCWRATLAQLVRRAYRRPPAPEELDRLLALKDAALVAGDSEHEAFVATLSAVLLSPHFLYRVERDPDVGSTEAHPVSPHELAARLSYFLTASMPDPVLAAKADDGTILSPTVLREEAARLLTSPESEPMVMNLARQWMSTQALGSISPSPEFFPDFDAELLAAMGQETELFFTAVFREPRPARELVDARFSYLNDRLAAHYGLPPPGSTTPVRVELSGPDRGGVLGLGSVLALGSTPVRPSQVLRGKWVLSQILCDEPSSPPFNVPPLSGAPGTTVREQLEEHARNPACASCHARMDPIGFALDAYDADGSHRIRDRQGHLIDVSGRFPDGTTVQGMSELRTYLAESPSVDQCVAQHLLVYGLARAPTHDDRCQAKAIGEATPRGSFSQLIAALVASPPFTARQGEGARP